MGCANRASPNDREASSVSDLPSSPVAVNPEEFPWADVYWVNEVLCRKYSFRNVLNSRGIAPAADLTSEGEYPCPGTQSLEGCKSINVSGLSKNVSEEELRWMCSKFGKVAEVKLLKPTADGDLGSATVTFEERLEAQQAQLFLHRARLHNKEIRVGWEGNEDAREASSHHWLYVWIPKGTTSQQLYSGFRLAGAPCTDACVVKASFCGEPEGVGGLAFRDLEEVYAIQFALPRSRKTDWSKLNWIELKS